MAISERLMAIAAATGASGPRSTVVVANGKFPTKQIRYRKVAKKIA